MTSSTLIHRSSHSRAQSTSSSKAPSLPPDYASEHNIELDVLTPFTTSSASLPTYDDAIDEQAAAESASSSSTAGFHPTRHLQIYTPGKPWLSLPLSVPRDPIPIYDITPTGQLGDVAYTSCRFARNSGTSYLVVGDDPAHVPVATTTYRFGPGKPPKLRLIGPSSPSNFISSPSSPSSSAGPELGPHDAEFEISGKSLASRSVALRTPYGTFEWRYASRGERKAAAADSLLVCERVVVVAKAGGGKEEHRTPVAQLVRNDELRSPGSGRSTAGNGGRLMVDLREWSDAKGDGEMVERMVVSSALCMLKKEVDRRRVHQMIIIAGGASG